MISLKAFIIASFLNIAHTPFDSSSDAQEKTLVTTTTYPYGKHKEKKQPIVLLSYAALAPYISRHLVDLRTEYFLQRTVPYQKLFEYSRYRARIFIIEERCRSE